MTIKELKPIESHWQAMRLVYEINPLTINGFNWLADLFGGKEDMQGSSISLYFAAEFSLRNLTQEGTVDDPVPFGEGTVLHAQQIEQDFGNLVGFTVNPVLTLWSNRATAGFSGMVHGIAKAIQTGEPLLTATVEFGIKTVPLVEAFYTDILRIDVNLDFQLIVSAIYVLGCHIPKPRVMLEEQTVAQHCDASDSDTDSSVSSE